MLHTQQTHSPLTMGLNGSINQMEAGVLRFRVKFHVLELK